MLRSLLASFLTALLLTTALLPARPALAADTLFFQSIRYPSAVKAGESITFQVQVTPVGEAALCCGSLFLNGPGNQRHLLRLHRTAGDMLEATLTLNPHTPEGTWEIASLFLWDSWSNLHYLEKLSHSFAVQRGDAPSDTKGPVLKSIKLPQEVTAGEIFPVTAIAEDDLSGVDRVSVFVQPQGGESPLWKHIVELHPTGRPGELVGYMVADPLTPPNLVQEISKVTLSDRAGNETVYERASMAANTSNKLTSQVKLQRLPPGLETSPYLNVIHPGENGYWNWLELDRQHMVNLLSESFTKAGTVREIIAAELPQLRAAVDQLRAEIYIDPATELKVSPYATTGKWLAVNAGILARIEMLTELDRQAGLTRPERTPLTASGISSIYTGAAPPEGWVAMENSVNSLYAQLPAALLRVLAQSPEAVAALKSPAWESPYFGYNQVLDRDVLYFAPIRSYVPSYFRRGQSSMMLTITPSVTLTGTVSFVFDAIGLHFAQAYIASPYAEDAPDRWKEYMDLRGAKDYVLDKETISLLEDNLGEDFGWSFLPSSLGEESLHQSLPSLKQNPEMAKQFREFVTKKLQTAPPVTTLTPNTLLETGTSSTFVTTVSPYSAAIPAITNGVLWGPSQPAYMKSVKNKDVAESSAPAPDVGHLYWFEIQARDSIGRTYHRNVIYYRAPVMLDPYPAATNQPTLTLTGSAPANQRVTVGNASARTDSQGRFRIAVPLKEGVNDLRLTVSGQKLAAAFKVRYEPTGTPVTLKVDLPGITRENSVWGSVKTEPYAMVRVNGHRFQADAQGEGPFFTFLTEGANTVEVVVTTTAGNTASWKGVVVKNTAAGDIRLNLPVLTNQKSYTLTGTVEPGSSLTINDTVVPVEATGLFKQTIALSEGPNTLKLVATDRAGNRIKQTSSITYSAQVPTAVTTSSVTLKGKVVRGTSLSYDGQTIPVGPDGSFQHEVPLNLGANTFVLTASQNGQFTGLVQFDVFLPVEIGTPTATPDGKLTLTGKTLPGYIINVNDTTIPIESDGTFTATFEKKSAPAIVTVTGEGKNYKVEVPAP